MDFFATCARGSEGALRRELTGLRMRAVRGDRGGVWFAGDLPAAMRVCLHVRSAMRVLLKLAEAEAGSPDALYAAARTVDWPAWVTPKTTIAVDASVRDSAVTHSGYAALKVKDAVVDAVRDKVGSRPDVDAHAPDVPIALHLAHDRATLSLDLSGEPLHRRGYRVTMTEAPLKETLAAAVLALGHVAHDRPFLDPMCGSGTLAIEHAQAARRIAPGMARRFAFQRWPSFPDHHAAWQRLRDEAKAAILPAAPAPIVARDLDPAAVAATEKNAAAAGVGRDLVCEVGDARKLAVSGAPGTICANPPYGERLGTRVEDLYRAFAAGLRAAHGWDVVILSGNPALEKAMFTRRKPDITHRLWNGPLEVRLVRWHIA